MQWGCQHNRISGPIKWIENRGTGNALSNCSGIAPLNRAFVPRIIEWWCAPAVHKFWDTSLLEGQASGITMSSCTLHSPDQFSPVTEPVENVELRTNCICVEISSSGHVWITGARASNNSLDRRRFRCLRYRTLHTTSTTKCSRRELNDKRHDKFATDRDMVLLCVYWYTIVYIHNETNLN